MITYENVTKIFGGGPDAVTALRDVSLEIEQGNLVIFLGPSGCGKTTLLRLTNRLLGLTRGKIIVDGQDIMKVDPVKLRQTIGYAIQQIGLFPNKTIADNIATVPKLLGWKKQNIQERVDELLSMLQLEPSAFRDRYPTELSGGQQQRIGVARCLAANPDILLMDEPFGAIDPINREEIQNEFLRLQRKLKKTIAFVTHDIHEAIKMGDKIAIFAEGQLVQYDFPETILAQPKDQYIADFVGADRALKVLGLIHVEEVMDRNPDNVVQGDTTAQEALRFLKEHDFRHLVVLKRGKAIGYVHKRQLREEHALVQELAVSYPVRVDEDMALKDVMSFMLMHDMRVLAVMDAEGNFAGTVAYDHIQKRILQMYAGEDESVTGQTTS
ncbi:MAG: ABC transporter ATP-binding protein [Desulfovermiculus sp.]|nr:ABC transporter ATP-binding protein [Desulfovermiculus sp.]